MQACCPVAAVGLLSLVLCAGCRPEGSTANESDGTEPTASPGPDQLETARPGLIVRATAGPFATSELRPGDVITALDGISLSSPVGVRRLLWAPARAEELVAEVQRGTTTLEIRLSLSLRNPRDSVQRLGSAEYRLEAAAFSQLLRSETARSLQMPLLAAPPDSAEGMLLVGLPPGGVLLALGLRDDDLLVDVNGQTVRGDEDIERIFDLIIEPGRVEISLVRRGRARTLQYRVE
jgi:S1-C subfamily serine protease